MSITAILAGAGLALALLVAWSGIVTIGVNAGHPILVERFLELAMTRSVQKQSSDVA